MPALLPYTAWQHVFEPLKGKRIVYARSIGNVGDRIIDMGLSQLMAFYGIEFVADRPDVVLCSGGGNFGDLYPEERAIREAALKIGKPVIVLPQSAAGIGEFQHPYQAVYFRDRISAAFFHRPSFAPDLSFCIEPGPLPEPEHDRGIFLRTCGERYPGLSHPEDRGDPALMVTRPADYLHLAARFKEIVTNRLHFAVCGLLAGRRVTLLPNSYHKNAAIFAQWLYQFGADFRFNIE